MDDEPPGNPADEMLRAFLEQGLRPAEIAVRLGIPVGDVHARLERVTARSEPLPPDGPSTPLPQAVEGPARHGDEHEDQAPSNVPVALVGIVVVVFMLGIAVFLFFESREAGQRTAALDREDGAIPPAIVQPTPTPTATPPVIDGVQLEPMALGLPMELPRNVALTVWDSCARCQRVVTYVQGPVGLESYPVTFDIPADARIFPAVATHDGATMLATAWWDREPPRDAGTAIFRSDDAGITWREVWRGPQPWSAVRLGPDHIAIGRANVPDEVVLVPGDRALHSDDPTLDELVPLTVFRTIEPREEVAREFGLPRVWSSDRDFYVTNLPPQPQSSNEQPTLVLGVFDPGGKLLRGWTGGAFLPIGTVLSGRVFLSAALTEAGAFPDSNDDTTYLSAALFDLDSGTLHTLDLPDPSPDSLQFIVSVREGPFVRVPDDVVDCLPIRVVVSAQAEPVACAAPNSLLRDLGTRSSGGAGEWAEVEVAGGTRGWVPLSSVVVLPR